ncbi:hypothetical protein [Salinibaculum rarum]|uniref:hypothetical protein n=1 Tax=Salinibaculum rarum TaxID=3058903 RepID=UPI00265FC454|nr:hypothetical protein [Salinibaculum sp. KK48]
MPNKRPFIGAYHDGRYTQRGLLLDDGRVRVNANGGPDDTITVSRDQWLDWFGSAVARDRHCNGERGRQLYRLFQQNRLTSQPQCSNDDCQQYLTPLEVGYSHRSTHADPATDEYYCRSCLSVQYGLFDVQPWDDPYDIFAEVRDAEGPALDSFNDPDGVLAAVETPADLTADTATAD